MDIVSKQRLAIYHGCEYSGRCLFQARGAGGEIMDHFRHVGCNVFRVKYGYIRGEPLSEQPTVVKSPMICGFERNHANRFFEGEFLFFANPLTKDVGLQR